MKPGIELDALIAEKVMRHSVEDIRGIGGTWNRRNDETGYRLLCYSTDIEDAWVAVDKMIADGWEVSEAGYGMATRKWDFTFNNGSCWPGPLCDTASHAICLAALKAVGHND